MYYRLTDLLADVSVLKFACVIPLDIPFFLIEVEVVHDMRCRAQLLVEVGLLGLSTLHRTFALAIASC
jgi:hypothetical protein